MDIEFNNLTELYQRLEPALTTKEADLKRNDYENITKRDIWDYLEVTKWRSAENLLLHQMVDNILNANNEAIIEFMNKRGKKNE